MKVERTKLFDPNYTNGDNVFSWLLVETMSDAGIENFTLEDGSLPEVFDIVMTVDGHEIDVVKAMVNLQGQLENLQTQARKAGYDEAWLEMETIVSEKIYSS